ncbi:MAG: SUMF1/EgtB/PvdO family nonheme iron enzyme [Sedimentisphaerales bacterium]|nr:SUMF1/EgtB/PvdO family nonheme iron enzyme [Sedimentisphaerales bacterium]
MLRKIVLVMILLTGILALSNAHGSDRGVFVEPSPRTGTGQSWALIIGINDYTNVPTLRYGRSDAETLAKTLIDKCGFPKNNVVLMTDSRDIRVDNPSLYPTRGNLSSRISQIAQLVGTNDLLIISFAGHGINIDGKGYIIPVDGDSKDVYSLIPLSLIKETLETSSAKQKLLILDACHSGARAGDETESPAQAILSPLNGAGFVTLASCDSLQLSHEDELVGRGVFTNAVIEGLEGGADTQAEGNRDGVITANELFLYSSLKVKQWSLNSGKIQTPVLKGEFTGRIEINHIGMTENIPQEDKGSDSQESPFFDDSEKPVPPVTLAIVVPAKTKAELMWDNVKDFDRSEGFDKLLDEIEIALKNAQTFYQEKLYKEAKSYFEDTISKCENIIILERQRNGEAGKIQIEDPAMNDNGNQIEEIEIPKYKQGEIKINSIGMKFVYIPAGEFMMGSPLDEAGREVSEGPQHSVKISRGFWMGVYEVTQAEYNAIMGSNPSYFTKGFVIDKGFLGLGVKRISDEASQHPVEVICWNDATEFCRKLSQKEGKTYSLPTEAQWEYACRAGTQTLFSFGDEDYLLGDYAWYLTDRVHPVGQKKANAFGLYDMHGNVWEWCQDWYEENYYSNFTGVDPQGPSSGSYHVLRGGSWYDDPSYCRSAARLWNEPEVTSNNYGFRVILKAE